MKAIIITEKKANELNQMLLTKISTESINPESKKYFESIGAAQLFQSLMNTAMVELTDDEFKTLKGKQYIRSTEVFE